MKLICFGYGYSARYFVARLLAAQTGLTGERTPPQRRSQKRKETGTAFEPLPATFKIIATHRRLEGKSSDPKLTLCAFSRGTPLKPHILDDTTHVLISVPPDSQGDPVFDEHGHDLARMSSLCWLGYLSTTGVYGNHEGAWVDESSPCLPGQQRGVNRLAAETRWLHLWHHHHKPTHIFRLPGIYGPGRNALETLRQGRAQRVVKPGQVFSRIHVEDIAAGLLASLHKPRPGAIYNLCDDEPAPPQDVLTYASQLLDRPAPPEIPFTQATLSPMAASFYHDNKRVRNTRIKRELGFSPRYRDYRSGLKSLLSHPKPCP